MSVEDDTFDIDIYGENEQQQPEPDYEQEIEDIADGAQYEYDNTHDGSTEHQGDPAVADHHNEAYTDVNEAQQSGQHINNTSSAPQGTKRKAPDEDLRDQEEEYPTADVHPTKDSQHLDPSATSAVKFADLDWWITEDDLRAFPARAGVEDQLRELSFNEHKINGKSRGEVYLEFSTPQAAAATKREVDKANKSAADAGPGKRKVLSVSFSPVGNPFKIATNATGGKYNTQGNIGGGGRGGAYNQNYGNQRGGFGGRGGYNANRGGFNNHRGNFNGMNQQQAGWMGGPAGMNGNIGGFGNNGYAGNPMMGMMNNFGNMNQSGMMNGMMGRGGFGMGNMNPMMNRGNMMGGMGMMGRGGWNGGGFPGGMQQGFGNGGFQNGGQGMPQQGNKRPKME